MQSRTRPRWWQEVTVPASKTCECHCAGSFSQAQVTDLIARLRRINGAAEPADGAASAS